MTLLLGMQVSRPDGKPDLLGLKVLDEPAAVQSDPSLLTMQLRQASKQASPLVADTGPISCIQRQLAAYSAAGSTGTALY